MKLSELTDKLQSLCHEGLSELHVTVDDKDNIEIEYKPNQKTINIRRAHQ